YGSASGDDAPAVRIANALDQTAPFLRRSLIPGLVATAHRNLARGVTDLSLFETGAVFLPDGGVTYGTDVNPPRAERPSNADLERIHASIPPQPRHVAVLFAGDIAAKQPGRPAEAAGLVAALDAVRVVGAAAGVAIDVAQTQRAALHPGRAGVLSVAGED